MTKNLTGYLITIFFALISFSVIGQEMMTPRSWNDRLIEKWDIRQKTIYGFHSAIRNSTKVRAVGFVEQMIASDPNAQFFNRSDLAYYLDENDQYLSDSLSIYTFTEKPVLKYFYKSRSKFLRIQENELDFYLNPVLHLSFSNDPFNKEYHFQNTRGFLLGGMIGEKLHFFTSLYENQRSFPGYIEEGILENKAIPGQGFYKDFQSSLFDEISGYDYLNAKAYIGGKIIKNIDFQFGHGNFFIGNGTRSLLLSDYGHNYLFLRLETRFNRFYYQNLFAELTAVSAQAIEGDVLLPKKYLATHYLSYQPTPDFEIGLFESVVFNRDQAFELQYLNPIILYRTVEQFLGSPDNILLGINLRWDLFGSLRAYGQLLIDEFRIGELRNNEGWWGNKYGYQLGLKYIDAGGINNLDLRIETNHIRPFTYSHKDSLTSYSHYHQALAHPLGSNFREYLFEVSFIPFSDLYFTFNGLYATKGEDSGTTNYGANILRSSNSRFGDYGHTIGQGDKLNIRQLKLQISYAIFHNCFFDLGALYRWEESEISGSDRYFMVNSGIRLNIENHDPDY